MSLFSKKSATNKCGAIIDVGSGSVGIAIVISEGQGGKLDVVWTHREHMLIKAERTTEELQKEISTTIINALLELGSNGLKALHAFDSEASIKYIQTAISAPWSYTITKTIQYDDENVFEVTKELILQLIESAKKQTLETTLDGKVIENLGLTMITDATVNVQLNGYSLENPIGNEAKSITLAHISALASGTIITALEESKEKILPKAKIEHNSFMFLFYQVLKYLHPDTSEICLIDVTNEATEIGIVRDNILRHTSYTQFGIYSLAREIARICSISNEEAFTQLKDGEVTTELYSKEKQAEIEQVYTNYENAIAELFSKTGDTLSIPKTLFLHTSKTTEAFFSERLKNAAQKATGGAHTVHLFTTELLGSNDMVDSALALSAHFFHTSDVYSLFKVEK